MPRLWRLEGCPSFAARTFHHRLPLQSAPHFITAGVWVYGSLLRVRHMARKTRLATAVKSNMDLAPRWGGSGFRCGPKRPFLMRDSIAFRLRWHCGGVDGLIRAH